MVEDKLSMSQNPVPFLGNDLVDFAMQVSVRLTLGQLHAVVRLNEDKTTGAKTGKCFQKTRDGEFWAVMPGKMNVWTAHPYKT